MTKAAWLIAGACVALGGVCAFLWWAGSGAPHEGVRAPFGPRGPRVTRADPNTGGAELVEAARPTLRPADDAGPRPAGVEAERTEVEDKASSSAGVFEFRVVQRGTKEPLPGAAITYRWGEPDSEEKIPWGYEDGSDFDQLAKRARADDRGHVRVPRRTGTLYAVARKDGFWGRETFDVDEDAPLGLEEVLEVAADWSLTVQVRDREDRPAAGVSVVLEHDTGRWSGATWKGETDAAGEHRYEHVGYRMATGEGGDWRVRLDLLLLEPVAHTLDPQEVVGETVVLHMPPVGSLEVVVHEADGAAAPDGTFVNAGIVEKDQPRDISPFSSQRREYVRVETTGGSAVFPFVELGQEFEVKVTHAGDHVETREFGRGPDVAGERRELLVTLGLANPVLVFRAVSEAGAPLPEKDLKLEMSFRSSFMSNSWDRSIKTDAEGLFRVDLDSNYEEGDLRFLVVSDGAGDPKTAQVDLAREFTPGQHDMGDVVLAAAPLLVAGRVVDPLGAPVAGAEIGLQVKHTRDDDNVWWDRVEPKGESDAEGDFEVRGVTPGTELYVTATRAGKRGEPVVARVGDAGVTLVLYGTGSLAGTVLLDEEITHEKIVVKVKRDDAKAPPEGMYGNSQDRKNLDGEGVFVLGNLIPGTYTVEVEIQNGRTPLRTFPGVLVADGAPTRDPRLQAIDLRGALFLHRLVLVTPKPMDDLQGSLQLWKSGETEGQKHWQWFHESPVEIVSPHREVDIELSVRGFRAVQLQGVRGEREIVLDDGLPIRLVLRTDGQVPEPPYYVKAVLVPLDDTGPSSIDWGAPCFDETREVRTRAYGTGRMKVQWLIEKRSPGGGAVATTANVEPEQVVEVLDTTAEQIIEVEISAEQLAGITKDL